MDGTPTFAQIPPNRGGQQQQQYQQQHQQPQGYHQGQQQSPHPMQQPPHSALPPSSNNNTNQYSSKQISSAAWNLARKAHMDNKMLVTKTADMETEDGRISNREAAEKIKDAWMYKQIRARQDEFTHYRQVRRLTPVQCPFYDCYARSFFLIYYLRQLFCLLHFC